MPPCRPLLASALVGALAASCAGPGSRAVTVYSGRYVDSALVEDILLSSELDTRDGYLAALAYSERFHSFSDGGGQWEWEGQLVQHFGDQDHQEFNGLVAVRWQRFPWSEKLRTSAAFGEGLSLATEEPPLELESQGNSGTNELLNYLLLEATFGLPSAPSWDFVLRIHHRSGIFGLFDDVSGGSNVVAVGLKYRF